MDAGERDAKEVSGDKHEVQGWPGISTERGKPESQRRVGARSMRPPSKAAPSRTPGPIRIAKPESPSEGWVRAGSPWTRMKSPGELAATVAETWRSSHSR